MPEEPFAEVRVESTGAASTEATARSVPAPGSTGGPGSRIARRRALLEVAGRQRGFFTSVDARSVGFTASAASRQRSVGNWLPTSAPGVWKLAEWPDTVAGDAAARALWWGPGAELTSWTALALLGLVAEDGQRQVHLQVDPLLAWPPRDRRRTWRRELGSAMSTGQIVVHRSRIGSAPSVTVDHLRLRPATEALCVAINYRDPWRQISEPVAEQLVADLLDSGRVDLDLLVRTATSLSAARVLGLVWERWQAARR